MKIRFLVRLHFCQRKWNALWENQTHVRVKENNRTEKFWPKAAKKKKKTWKRTKTPEEEMRLRAWAKVGLAALALTRLRKLNVVVRTRLRSDGVTAAFFCVNSALLQGLRTESENTFLSLTLRTVRLPPCGFYRRPPSPSRKTETDPRRKQTEIKMYKIHVVKRPKVLR